ncbi:hypothetical protein WICPIJ_009099 [Wickerhamomyces pijperi]|uniref:Uncharacterized protein n=1 Tax=Wickerhamomyces pijperi TaxID=599730 RepID=A0A9P8TED6_WICPI|nr:hypothetical protein WICPIJ_009099 [Wickerhamomyces pijperi]
MRVDAGVICVEEPHTKPEFEADEMNDEAADEVADSVDESDNKIEAELDKVKSEEEEPKTEEKEDAPSEDKIGELEIPTLDKALCSENESTAEEGELIDELKVESMMEEIATNELEAKSVIEELEETKIGRLDDD